MLTQQGSELGAEKLSGHFVVACVVFIVNKVYVSLSMIVTGEGPNDQQLKGANSNMDWMTHCCFI